MKPKLAYIAGQFPLRSETFVYREVRALRQRGWEVTCVSLRPTADAPEASDDLTDDLITVYHPQTRSAGWGTPGIKDAVFAGETTPLRDRLKLIYQARVALGLSTHLRQRGITHIHAHFAHAPATIAMYAARTMNIPFSFTGHANDLFQRRALLKRKLQRAKFVSCISEQHRQLYNSIFPRPDADYPIIRCGVDIASFNLQPRTPNAISKILTVCRLVEKKGVDTLIRAFAQLDTPAELLIAGDGPQRAELEAIAAQTPKAGQVHFLGSVSNERVRELLQSCDIFALPCRVDRNGDKDGIPVVLIEAMACGLPVVAGDLPAIRELVVDNQTGLLVDATSIEPTLHALHKLLSNPDLASRLSCHGRDRVASEFALSENVARLEHAFQQP